MRRSRFSEEQIIAMLREHSWLRSVVTARRSRIDGGCWLPMPGKELVELAGLGLACDDALGRERLR